MFQGAGECCILRDLVCFLHWSMIVESYELNTHLCQYALGAFLVETGEKNYKLLPQSPMQSSMQIVSSVKISQSLRILDKSSKLHYV